MDEWVVWMKRKRFLISKVLRLAFMAFKGKRRKLVYWTILFQVKDIVDAGKIYRVSIKIIPLTFEQINK